MANPTMTREDVCRLLGRVAFGATAADIDEWTGKPYADLVDRLLLVPTVPVGADEGGRVVSAPPALSFSPDLGCLWWMERMRTTPAPLVERMTLFWHGHFATAVRQPPNGPTATQVSHQLETLRVNALGNFRTIVELMTVDAAMLVWLNGTDNRVPNPNENYARELFELFTLGKRPQVYTEKDIREAARALTGWWVDRSAEVVTRFDAGRHDTGTKRILGQAVTNLGAEEYRKVVEIALAQRVAPLFLAYKLVQEFAYVPRTRNVLTSPDPLVKKVAATLSSSGWDVAKAMRTLLLADEFRLASPLKGQQRVRQPVEQVVAACKALGVNADNQSFVEPLTRMGQRLLEPPNVGGWPAGIGWLSPVTQLGRYDLALRIRSAMLNLFSPTSAASLATGRLADLPAPADIAGWAKTFGLPGLSATTSNAIKTYVTKRKSDGDIELQAGVIALILSSPEWVVM